MNTGDAHGDDGPERVAQVRRKKLITIAVASIIIAAFSIWALYEPYESNDFKPHLSIIYAIAIASNSSDEYRILCPVPLDYDEMALPQISEWLHVTGECTQTLAETENGPALEIMGKGIVLMTLSIKVSSTDGEYENLTEYYHLSLITFASGSGYQAIIYSNQTDLQFGMQYGYDHVYGNVGADHWRYECTGNLDIGQNMMPISIDSWVS